MQDGGDFRDALFENAERAGIRQHQRGDIFSGEFAQVIGVDLAARVRFDVLNFVSGDHHRCGIGAVRGIGDQNFFARIALAFRYARIISKPVSSPCAPATGCSVAASMPVIASRHFCRS